MGNERILMNALRNLADLLNCTQADIHTIHLMVAGGHFFNVHTKAQEYYEKIRDDYDTVLEMVLSLDEEINHPLDSGKKLNYKPISIRLYSREESYNIIIKAFGNILDYIKLALSEVDSIGHKATLEAMYAYYEIERNYKLSRCIAL